MISMNKIIISLLFFLLNIHLFGQKNKLAPLQSESSLPSQDDKRKALDYIILNEHREDTIWCEVTERDNYKIYYTTRDNDKWGKDFRDISVCHYRMNGKVMHYERPNFLTSEPWEYISDFTYGYAYIYNKTRATFIDSTGKCASDCPFEFTGIYHYGYTWAYNKNNLLIINSKCEVKYTVKNVIGEMGAVFFDSIIVIYAMKKDEMNFSTIDYNFSIIIPHKYSSIHKSSSERYYLVGRPHKIDNFGPTLWGVYDIIARKEIVPCSYSEKLVTENGIGTYTFGDDFLKVVENLKLSVPPNDEISERLNGRYGW
jgi:hypothetical protein